MAHRILRYHDYNANEAVRYNAARWNAMSSEEREEYLAANKDLGNKR